MRVDVEAVRVTNGSQKLITSKPTPQLAFADWVRQSEVDLCLPYCPRLGFHVRQAVGKHLGQLYSCRPLLFVRPTPEAASNALTSLRLGYIVRHINRVTV